MAFFSFTVVLQTYVYYHENPYSYYVTRIIIYQEYSNHVCHIIYRIFALCTRYVLKVGSSFMGHFVSTRFTLNIIMIAIYSFLLIGLKPSCINYMTNANYICLGVIA